MKTKFVIVSCIALALLCCLLTGGCGLRPDTVEPPTMPPTTDLQASPPDTVESPTMTPTPYLQALPTDTVKPPTIPPTPDPQAYGSLLYIDGRSVWEGMGLASDRLIAELPFEKIYAATLADNLLWVLADDQLAVVDLISGTAKTMTEIETSVWGGQLLMLQKQQSIVYAVGVDDDSTLLGRVTCVGLYGLQTEQARLLAKLPGTVVLLGTTTEEDALYAMQIGGDGGFGTVLTINLEDGMTNTEIELQRTGVEAAMSLDNRWVAVVDAKNWSQPEEEGCITLYSLVEPDSPPTIIDLPHKPSHARGVKWALDSQHLYFVLWPGPWAGGQDGLREQTYGLWQLDVLSGEVKEIVPSIRPDHTPVAISPDERATLIGSISFDLIDVQTGAELSLDLPPGAQIVAWRTPGTR